MGTEDHESDSHVQSNVGDTRNFPEKKKDRK